MEGEVKDGEVDGRLGLEHFGANEYKVSEWECIGANGYGVSE